MDIELRLLAGLKTNLPETSHNGAAILELGEGAALRDAVRFAGIDFAEDAEKTGKALVILLNGRYAGLCTPIRHGDVISVFPPVPGVMNGKG